MKPQKFGIGKPVRRARRRRIVGGCGRYVADFMRRQILRMRVVLRSPHAHARLRSPMSSACGRCKACGWCSPARRPRISPGPCPRQGQCRRPDQGAGLSDARARRSAPCRRPVAFVVADSWSGRKMPPRRSRSTYGAAAGSSSGSRRSRRARRWSGPTGTNLAFETAIGARRGDRDAFAKAAQVVELRSSTSGWSPIISKPAASIAEYDRDADRTR